MIIITITTNNPINAGLNTIHHDQSIIPANFNPIKRRSNNDPKFKPLSFCDDILFRFQHFPIP